MATTPVNGRVALSSLELEPVEPEPLLTVVVPTKNERGNVPHVVERLEAALPTVPLEIVFVDDSNDGTAELVEDLAAESGRSIVLLKQTHDRHIGGLGAAVVQGLRAARAPWVCVMDADLQHPPELVAALLEQAESRDLDVVVASRYCAQGDAGSFGWARAMASRSTTTAARLLFPRRLRSVTDPMSGFFLVRRDALDLDRLRPRGFKILLELLVRHPDLRAAEVSFSFGERRFGRSKAGIREGVRYLSSADEAALRTLWRCGSFRARREHGGPRLPHGLRRDLLRRVRRLRHPGRRRSGTSASPSSGCSRTAKRGAAGALAWLSSS